MKVADDYVVAKTDNRSMLAGLNQLAYDLQHNCGRFLTWEDISLDCLEDVVMNSLFGIKELRNQYISPLEYWQQVLSNEKENN